MFQSITLQDLFKKSSFGFSVHGDSTYVLNKYPVALSFKCWSGKCVNMGMVHSIYQIRSGGFEDVLLMCNTARCMEREDCMIPLPESRLVCIPSLVLQKIKDVIPYVGLLVLFLPCHNFKMVPSYLNTSLDVLKNGQQFIFYVLIHTWDQNVLPLRLACVNMFFLQVTTRWGRAP